MVLKLVLFVLLVARSNGTYCTSDKHCNVGCETGCICNWNRPECTCGGMMIEHEELVAAICDYKIWGQSCEEGDNCVDFVCNTNTHKCGCPAGTLAKQTIDGFACVPNPNSNKVPDHVECLDERHVYVASQIDCRLPTMVNGTGEQCHGHCSREYLCGDDHKCRIPHIGEPCHDLCNDYDYAADILLYEENTKRTMDCNPETKVCECKPGFLYKNVADLRCTEPKRHPGENCASMTRSCHFGSRCEKSKDLCVCLPGRVPMEFEGGMECHKPNITKTESMKITWNNAGDKIAINYAILAFLLLFLESSIF